MALNKYHLPLQVMSQGDVSRINRELHDLDDFIKQVKLRQPGTPLQKLPKTSKGLDEFASLNKLNLLLAKDRQSAISFFELINKKANIIHISFATDPSASFMSKITNWLRVNIDPSLLINVGLEPTIAAGCTIRTNNKFHDFSLRKHFDAQRPLLLSKIKGPEKLYER